MIEVSNLTQTYRSGKGIFDVDFTVKEGEMFGYLGPNGAGKTTTIRNLLGFANADKGSAKINGLDCRKDAAKLQDIIGYLPGEMAFFDNMTGLEFLNFIANMRRTRSNGLRDKLIEQFDLDTVGKIKKMSKGMKQKLGIITTFMHDPKVYILDEPTSGLDPFMQNIFMKLIIAERGRGKTILMSSHIFEEIQTSCDRAGIIREGRIVAIENVKSLNEMQAKSYIVKFSDENQANKVFTSDFDAKKINENTLSIAASHPYNEFFKILSQYDVVEFSMKQDSLEDVFMKYYGEVGVKNE